MSHIVLKNAIKQLYNSFEHSEIEAELAKFYLNKAYESKEQPIIDDLIQKAQVLHSEYAYLWFARVHRQHRQYDQACKYYLECFSKNPKNTDNRYEIGEFVLRHGQQHDILWFFNILRDIDPSDHYPVFIIDCFHYYNELIEDIKNHVGNQTQKRKLLINVALWGEMYAHIFCEYQLPSLAAKQNLSAILDRYDIHLIIMSDHVLPHRINNVIKGLDLNEIANVHIISFPKPLFEYALSYQQSHSGWTIPPALITNSVHYATLECGRQINGDIITLWPDHILPENFITSIVDCSQNNAGLVAGPTFRLYYDQKLLSKIDSSFRQTNGVLSIPAKEMVRLLIEFLPHENYIDSDHFTTFPIYLCWKINNEGIIASINHCSPWFVRGDQLLPNINLSLDPIDGFCFSKILKNPEDIQLLPDEVICFDLGENPTLFDKTQNTYSIDKVASWFAAYYTPIHEKYMAHPYLLKTSPQYTESIWKSKEAEIRKTLLHINQKTKQSLIIG